MKITHFVALGIVATGLVTAPSAEAGWFWRRRPVVVVEPAPVVRVVPDKKVWVEGHYAVRRGVRVWVPGQWVVVDR
jgi:hypothetical protein